MNVKNHRETFIRGVLHRHGYSDPGKKKGNFIKPFHTDCVKELEITSGPSNETDAKDILDKMKFKYRYILGEIIFPCVAIIPYISYGVA